MSKKDILILFYKDSHFNQVPLIFENVGIDNDGLDEILDYPTSAETKCILKKYIPEGYRSLDIASVHLVNDLVEVAQ